jgi:site-specific recombinase XerD
VTPDAPELLPPALPVPCAETVAAAEAYLRASTAPATRRAYASDWRLFVAWGAAQGVATLPAAPETVALFLAAQAELGVAASTLARRAAALRYAHEAAGHPTPTQAKLVAATLAGIRRTHGAAPQGKAPATAERIAAMVAHCPPTLAGQRDRALLLLGFAGAFRRSELVALEVADLEPVPEGLKVRVRHSKTDPTGQGQVIPILNGARLRPVDAVRTWLAAAGIAHGPVFRPFTKAGRPRPVALSDRSVANLVKHYAGQAGFVAEDFAGHSLRAGFLTSGAEAGASLFKLLEVSRHRRLESVRHYVRLAELFKDHAGADFL